MARACHGGLDPTFAPAEGWDKVDEWEAELEEAENGTGK